MNPLINRRLKIKLAVLDTPWHPRWCKSKLLGSDSLQDL